MAATDEGGGPEARWPQAMTITADAESGQVRVLRRSLTAWLRGDHLADDVLEDLVLATSEALENCAEHARDPGDPGGTMTVTARSLDGGAGLEIAVGDDGRWQPARHDAGHRGRGLAMMRTLVDDVTVETGPSGTRVVLTHYAA